MGFLIGMWNAIKDGLEFVLRFYEGLLEPFLGEVAWGLSIILLTVTVRIFMIPLMVRQTKSMRSMQTIQPELKKIQEKYKADRSMMKTDPERYKKIKEKQREAQMALYQEHQVNPVGGCLPLLLQMPVFLALFQVLQGGSLAEELGGASFLGIPSLTGRASDLVSGGSGVAAAIAAVVLIVLQVGTTYWSQKQMMARNTQAAAEQAQVQKIMLYVMPFFLGYLSFTFPLGVVLYWVTTNFWTMGQQAIIFRKVEAHEAKKAGERDAAKIEKAQRKHVEDVTSTGDDTIGGDGAAKDRAKRAPGKGGGSGGPPTSSGRPRSRSGGKPGSSSGSGSKPRPPQGGQAKGGSTGGRANGNRPDSAKPSAGGSSIGKPSGADEADGGAPRRTTRRSRPPDGTDDSPAAPRNGRTPTPRPTGTQGRTRPANKRSKPGSTR